MLAYLAVNKINGKGYVGITTHSVDYRWKKHVTDAKRFKHLFAKAIRISWIKRRENLSKGA